MTITVYRSDDASAPTLTGQVGSLTTLLDAVLINGYGSKAAAGGSGAWAIAFTGTNTRAYRSATGNRMYLAVDDTNPAPASLGANYGRLTGYESMTSAILGTKGMPSAAQNATSGVSGIGSVMIKSTSADSVTRPWMIFASETFIHMFVLIAVNAVTGSGFYNNLGATNVGGFQFGDLVNQQKAGDAFATILICGNTTTPSNSLQTATCAGNSSSVLVAHWIQRAFTQFGNAIQCSKGAVSRGVGNTSTLGSDSAAPNFPDPITGGMEMSEIWIFEVVSGLMGARGRVPGIYNPMHTFTSLSGTFQFGDIVPGAGAYAGINFMVVTPGPSGIALMQISGTW